ncbi:MAG: TerB family tellurite resistance protein [Ghiorsea sp.]|nr:TerB family tellurite resistance protein [Ghiorsea sp.]MDQ6980450.1 TerB family tellurite resistance protein [Ghiorsea sp.]MDQ7058760.1 TerB family tellurite resistance protein [Ghiorsea sp.]
MLKKIKAMFHGSKTDESKAKKHDISLAVTAMMIEIMRIDGNLEDTERQVIFKAIEKRFDLSHEEVETLIKEATQAQAKSTDLHQFTSLINNQFSTQERIDFLKELWQVAMADGHIDPYEEQLIRRVAGLIGVYHGEFIQAKIDARNEGS